MEISSDSCPESIEVHRQSVERVIAVMRERTDDNTLPLTSMADIAHLSPYYFARVFRQVTGIAPGEFLSAIRLERAKQLLLTTSLSVTEVCFEVGYNSLGTFTSRYTQLVGVSPGRMRHLSAEVGCALERLREPDPDIFPATPKGNGIFGRIVAPDLTDSLIFMGLFPGAIPQRRPIACTLLVSPGTFHIDMVPDGRYHLMAAALPLGETPLECLMSNAPVRVGRGETPLLVRSGVVEGTADITLRPLRITDPPVLVSLPALLLNRLNTWRESMG